MKRYFLIIFPLLLILMNCSSDDNTISLKEENIKQNEQKRILILNSYHESYHWTDRIMSGIKSTFNKNENVELFINYLDTKRSSDSTHFELEKELLLNKYKKIQFDAILSTDDHALNFLLKYRDELFPNVPVVFCGVNDFTPSRIAGYKLFTGVYETYDVEGTIDLLLDLHPKTNNIIVISDATLSGDYFKGRVERAETSFKNKISFEYLTNLSPDELSLKLGAASDETTVIWSIYLRTPDGVSISCERSVKFISESTKQPVYCVWDVVGQGVVGGKITNPVYQGERASEMILEIFDGKKTVDIPVEGSPTVFKFDYNVLQKFDISETKLPAQSIVINKPFSFYQTYLIIIWIIIGIMVFLIAIVLILLRSNHLQKLAKLEISKKNEEYERLNEELTQANEELFIAKDNAELNEKKFKMMTEKSPLAIYTSSGLEQKADYINPTFTKLFGYTISDVPTVSDWWPIAYPDEEYRNDLIKKWQEKVEVAIKSKSQIEQMEAVVTCKDGTERNILWGYVSTGLQNWAFGLDLTQRRRVEAELIVAKEEAEKSDRLKSAFLANMSHEIRTPMNGILGFAKLLKEPNLKNENLQKYIQIIERSGFRMLNIINDIVDISKIEAGLMKVNIKDSNINQQIEYIYTFFKPEIEGKGMTVTFNTPLPEEESIIKTDREKVFSILTNLVKNAIKYSKEGEIKIGYVVKYDYIEFYVKDNGIGIPKDRQKAIFERFIQADIADKMALQGAGLGLSISKAYIEMLGGKIWVESEEGVGSTFYFTIPYQINSKKKIMIENFVSSEIEANDIQNLKILIAEDDETSEMLISIIIKDFCKEVLIAKTGKEVVEICRNNPDINLILMDIQMPFMDGYEATRQIRQFNKEVIIIAQTAFALSGDSEKSIKAGCNEYITKPIIKNKLLKIIEKYFKK